MSTVTLPNGVVVGMRPVARNRQRVAQVELTEEHRALQPHELIETHALQIDKKSGVARLARRPTGEPSSGNSPSGYLPSGSSPSRQFAVTASRPSAEATQNYSGCFSPRSGLSRAPRHIVTSFREHKRMTYDLHAECTDESTPDLDVAGTRSALLAIAAGGLIAGALDLTQACILFGWDIPLSIAGGLLGRQALHGGAGTYALGVLLHFFIALSAATVYYVASRRLGFLREHPLVCGLFFGMAVELVMRLVVLPLSALHARGPYELHDEIQGLLVHMVVVGLPISFSVRWFAR